MNQRSVGVRRGGLIVLTAGLLLLVPGVIALVGSLSFFGKAERAEAVFGGAVLRNSSYGMMYYPEFTFQTKDGRDMTFRSRIGSSDQEYAPGAKIAVLYDPTDPEHMEADTLLGVWLFPVLLLPPALLVVSIAITLLVI
jgi:Protein of unknown function (DUF3592)